jgi:hypothetical protein
MRKLEGIKERKRDREMKDNNKTREREISERDNRPRKHERKEKKNFTMKEGMSETEMKT